MWFPKVAHRPYDFNGIPYGQPVVQYISMCLWGTFNYVSFLSFFLFPVLCKSFGQNIATTSAI